LARRKLQQKRDAEEHSKRRDPETVILERKQSACKAYVEANNLLDTELSQEEKDKLAAMVHK
jgi:hypothetical protein